MNSRPVGISERGLWICHPKSGPRPANLEVDYLVEDGCVCDRTHDLSIDTLAPIKGFFPFCFFLAPPPISEELSIGSTDPRPLDRSTVKKSGNRTKV